MIRLACVFLLLCLTLARAAANSGAASPPGPERCSRTVQRIAKPYSESGDWLWVLVGAFNHLGRDKWETYGFDGLDGYWYFAFQSNDPSVCDAFERLVEAAGYDVR